MFTTNKEIYESITSSDLFNAEWYVNQYPDVIATGLSAVEHYVQIGATLGRDPSPHFSTSGYYKIHADVAAAGVNPLYHYIKQGNSEFRSLAQPSLLTDFEKLFSVLELNVLSANQIADNEHGNLTTVGNDPYFCYEISTFSGYQGWLFISITDNLNTLNKLKWYFDYGDGYSELNSFVHLKNDHKETFLVYIEKPLKGIRFDPTECSGVKLDFHMSIAKVSVFHALNWLKFKLIESGSIDLDKFNAQFSTSASIAELLEDLYKQYMLLAERVDDSYQAWIENNETMRSLSVPELAALVEALPFRPSISIVMPTYNTDADFLRLTIESVRQQMYPYWQLCIADDASTEPHVRSILEEYAQLDERINIVFRPVNGHISAASNSALELVNHDWVALLDHDDLLSFDALYHVAKAITENEQIQIIYSDEDKIGLHGQRVDPHFKSEWNPDLLFSQNYVSHLGVYKASLLQKIGGFRKGVEGSQDYDLILRCLPHLDKHQVFHIPKVLYHWRVVLGSTAMDAGEKSYTTDAGIRALENYFFANGPEGVLVEQGKVANTYKVNWPIPAVLPKVTLLIPTRDRKAITEVAVLSILEKTTYPNYEIIILDNGSVELETLQFFDAIQKQDQRVSVLRYDYPFNYSAINNYGVEHSTGELVGLINNDIEVINSDWLTEMVSHAIRPDIGCVGAKLYYSNGLIQHAGVICSLGGVAGHSHKYFPKEHPGYFHRLMLVQNLSAVTAAVLLVKRAIFNEVGGLNGQDLKVAFNDVDFCLKVAKAGYRNLWTPYAELYHHESISRGHEDTPEKQARFQVEVEYMKRTWPQELNRDPYYSPNLTKDREDFSINLS